MIHFKNCIKGDILKYCCYFQELIDLFQAEVTALGLLKFPSDDNRSFAWDTSLLRFHPSFRSGCRPKSICVPPVAGPSLSHALPCPARSPRHRLPAEQGQSVLILCKRGLAENQDTAFETPGSGVVQLWIKRGLGHF